MTQGPSVTPTEIVFVFDNLPDWQQLAAGVRAGAQVVVLDGAQDGLAQIAAHLQGLEGVDAIHILSHGQPGSLQLGALALDEAALATRADTLAQIGSALSDSGDILLYGCDVAQDSGAAFVEQIASLTQADVAASTDRTGAAERGGNWVLEFGVGEVFSSHIFNPDGLTLYDHLLALPPGTQSLGDTYWSNNTGVNTVDGFALTESTGAARASSPNSIYYNTAVVKDDPGVAGNYYYELTWTADGIDLGKFDLDGMVIQSFGGNYRLDFSATSGGSYVSQTFTYDGPEGPLTVDLNTATFNDINAFTVRVTNLDGATSVANIDLQQLLLADLNPPSTAPTIGNLNGDTVPWAGVGNSVVLDNGGNASLTDADLGALNSGNGNWAGASLAVQRAGGAVTADTFGISTAGSLFTVSGGDLQSGGQTFATYTNAGGVLTVHFTSTGTAATTALVNDVARHISYRNDAPGGDSTLRFTLSDGVASTTADVAVTSDTIYVTNATDTATINLSNGVSFSEAIAIAAADATGTQTIVIDGSLAGQTVSTAAASSLGENLTLNLGEASGVTLAGGSLAINGGALITLVNGAGDTAILDTALTGAGGLAKSGAGVLTVSGNNTGHTGSVTVAVGTLSAAGGAAIGDTSAVTVQAAATLALGSGAETIGSLAGTGEVSLGTNTLTTGGNNTTTTYSGLFTGSGNLVKVGSGTQILSNFGNSSSMSGDMTVSGGVLSISSDAQLSSGTIILNGGTFRATALTTVDNAIVLAADSTINTQNSLALDGVVSGSGNLTKTGTSTLVLNAANTYTGTTHLTTGYTYIKNSDSLGTSAGGTTVDSGAVLYFVGSANITDAITIGGTGINPFGAIYVQTGTSTISGVVTLTANTTINVDGSNSLTFAGGITDGAGSYSLTKGGSGTMTLSGAGNYDGITAINNGSLLVNGALSGTSSTTVASGATLGGNGSISNNVTVNSGGTLSPGNSAGSMTIHGNLTMASGSTLAVEINGATAGTGYDQVIVNGAVDVSGAALAVTHGYTPGSGDTYNIIVNDLADAATGTFSGLAEGGTLTAGGNNTVLTSSYIGGTGNDFTLTAAVNAAPTVSIILTDYFADEQVAINLHGTGISVQDIDGDPLTVTVTGAGANSNLAANVGSTGVVIVSGDNTNTLILYGTIAQLNALFTGSNGGTLTYRLSGDTPVATRLLTISASDGSLSGNDTAIVNITAVNDAPVNSVPGAQVAMEDAALVFSAGNGNQIEVDDLDSGSSDLEITLAVTNGTLTLAGIAGLSFSAGDGTTDSAMTFTGTQSGINAALATLTFNPTANFNGSATLNISTNDLGNTGSGGALTDSDSVSINVNPTNDAPTVANPIADRTGTQGVAFNFQFAVSAFADIDVGDTLTYSAQLAGGGALPAWLSFNPSTRTFSGTPTGAGTVSIDVIANDGNGGTVTDSFDVVIGTAPVVTPPEPEPEPPVTPPTPGLPDTDRDGVPNTLEDQTPGITGSGGTTTLGDGNGDGIRDSEQPSVASIGFVLSPPGDTNPGNAPLTFSTLVVSSQNGKVASGNDNSRITSLEQLDAPQDLPAGMQMPIGLVSFTVALGQGKTSESFSLYLDPALGVNGYWKQDATGTWTNIASEPYGGKMVMEGGRVRLDFQITDGGQFDADGKVDGIITDPGAPGYMPLSIAGQAPDLGQGFWF